MLNLFGQSLCHADGLSRRSVLRIGALGGLSALWQQRLIQATEASRADVSVILFWMAGGPSHIDTYDMKPSAPEQIRGPFKPIATSQPGLNVCELLPQHAIIGDRLAVLRSITHDLAVHDDAQHWVQTGYPLLNARQRGQTHPAQGAVVSKLRGPTKPGMPAYVCIPEDYQSHLGFYQTAAYLGPRHNAFNAGGDPSLGNYRPPEFNLPAGVSSDRLQNRRGLLKEFDALQARVDSGAGVSQVDTLQQQAFELIAGSRVRDALDLTREPTGLRDRYGRHAYGQSALIARRLVEAGASFVNINLYEKDVDWWDDHTTIEKNLRKRLPPFDSALSTLILDLIDRGMLERTLVVACGEFGRSPRIDSGLGRGHWPKAGSVLLAGGGIKPGIVGATTADGGQPADHAVGPGDLLATIYAALGIETDTMLRDRQNRPSRLVPTGEPIFELI